MTESKSTDESEPLTLESPFRPLPLGAKKALTKNCEDVEFPDDNPRIALVHSNEEIPEDILSDWELSIQRDPEEVWETDHGEIVEIYDDKVVIEGQDSKMEPDSAKSRVRQMDNFQQIE